MIKMIFIRMWAVIPNNGKVKEGNELIEGKNNNSNFHLPHEINDVTEENKCNLS